MVTCLSGGDGCIKTFITLKKEAYGIYRIWANEEGKGHVHSQNRSKHLLRVIHGFSSEGAGESHIF